MDARGFLPEYTGTVVHDGWGSYNKYECEHALCNAHFKRELTGIEKNFEQQWDKEINGLLSEVKKYTDECKEMEIPIDLKKVREFEEIYDSIIQEGIEENPVSYTHLRAHETPEHLVCRLLLEKKKKNNKHKKITLNTHKTKKKQIKDKKKN